jgi:formamidopyrimidine-DNA glycosylase
MSIGGTLHVFYGEPPMPEIPDLTVYIDALKARIVGRPLRGVTLMSPFVLRSVEPPITILNDQIVHDVSRLGKRIVLAFEDELFVVVHLMIAGRLRWRDHQPPEAPSSLDAGQPKRRRARAGLPVPAPKLTLAIFEFDDGRLYFTEAGSRKRASLQLVRGAAALAALDPGGLEPFGATLDQFRAALSRESHTIKRALTDPHLISGIGNAYSDEILHAARLSPLKLTRSLTEPEWIRLYDATQTTLAEWIERLRAAAAGQFPEKVTAFHEEMAVHGRFRQPCPVCTTLVQRIRYADNECNYCPVCQTGGRLLADRSLSRLLKDDWPKSVDEL